MWAGVSQPLAYAGHAGGQCRHGASIWFDKVFVIKCSLVPVTKPRCCPAAPHGPAASTSAKTPLSSSRVRRAAGLAQQPSRVSHPALCRTVVQSVKKCEDRLVGVGGRTDYSYLMCLVAQHDTLTDTHVDRQYSTFLFAALERKRTETRKHTASRFFITSISICLQHFPSPRRATALLYFLTIFPSAAHSFITTLWLRDAQQTELKKRKIGVREKAVTRISTTVNG